MTTQKPQPARDSSSVAVVQTRPTLTMLLSAQDKAGFITATRMGEVWGLRVGHACLCRVRLAVCPVPRGTVQQVSAEDSAVTMWGMGQTSLLAESAAGLRTELAVGLYLFLPFGEAV